MRTSPLISVLMPTRNGGRYVAESIGSVLAQDFDDFELLISDDGSTDDTLSIIESFSDPRLSLICQNPKPGLFANHNHLLRHSKGQWIKYLHQDDVLMPDALRTYASLTLGPEDPAFIAARTNLMDENGVIMGAFPWCFGESRIWGPGELTNLSLRLGNIIGNPPSVLFRRSALEDTPFNEDLKNSADWDVLLSLSAAHSVQSTAHVLVGYRVHAEAQSSINQGNQTTAFEDLAILRRRSPQPSEASAGAMAGMWRQHLQIIGAIHNCLRQNQLDTGARLAKRLLEEDTWLDVYGDEKIRKDIQMISTDPTEQPLFRFSIYKVLWKYNIPISLDAMTALLSRDVQKIILIGFVDWNFLIRSLCSIGGVECIGIIDIYKKIQGPSATFAPTMQSLPEGGFHHSIVMGQTRLDDYLLWRAFSQQGQAHSCLRFREWLL